MAERSRRKALVLLKALVHRNTLSEHIERMLNTGYVVKQGKGKEGRKLLVGD